MISSLSPLYRRGLIAAAGVVVLLAVVIVAPGFIDWTPYRDTFARQLSSAIGRPVAIDGRVTFVLVPRPALQADRVRVGSDTETVTIGGVKARLGFLPLLRGDLYVRDLRLDDAQGAITVDLPWTVTPPAAAGDSPQPAPPAINVDVERIELNGGDLTLRDRGGATLVRMQGMEIEVSDDGRDRFRVVGDLRLNDEPMNLDARLGTRGGDGVRAVSVSARVPAAEAVFSISGRVSFAKRSFDGDVNVKGERGTALFAALGLPVGETPALTRAVSLSAKSSADAAGVAFNGLAINVGGTAANGVMEWRRERMPQLTLRLDFAPFALEDWRPRPASAPAVHAPQAVAPAARTAAAEKRILETLTADIALRFPALSYRSQGLRDGRVTATMAAGELRIADVSVTLPGTTRLQASGLVTLADPSPAVDGIVSLETFDARGFFAWLGADVAGVPPGRLSSASLQGALQGSLNFLEMNAIEGALDTARIVGRLSFAPRDRPFFGVDLRVANVNFDSYRGRRQGPAAEAPASPTKPEIYGVTPTGTAFAGLAGFDAEVHVELDGVTAGGLPGGRVGLDLGLKNGALDIRTASFEKIAGTTAWASGSISGFGTALEFKGLQFDLAGDDIARLAALVGVDLHPALTSLGAAALTGTLSGGALQANVTATLKAAGLTARATGQIMELDKDPRFSGQIEANHPRFSELMRATPASWPANMRDPGALSLQAKIVQESGKTTIADARLAVGRDRIAGGAVITRVDDRPQVTVHLTDILLDLDRLLPLNETAPARAASGAAKPAAAPTAPVSPWSQDPVTWSFLKGWSGEITVAGPAFAARGVAVQNFSARIAVGDGAAELADWQGDIFGAPGQLSLRLAASPEPSLQGQLAVKRADFRGLVAALNGGRTNLKSGGTADIVASFATRGTSAAGFAGALSGAATLDVAASETGGGFSAGLLGPLNAAAQLDVGTPGKPAPITFRARLVATDGLVKFESAEVSSRSHTGSFAGKLDLPRRQVDVSGILVPRKAGEDPLPISIRGVMDRPTIRLLPPPKS